ncbi:MAG: threonine-phosphate decarboxylase CobD [Pseudomonadota bacterium]
MTGSGMAGGGMAESGPREHGGGLEAPMAAYGGAIEDWIDLSTGINRVPYPVPPLSPRAWTALPQAGALEDMLAAAGAYFGVPAAARLVAAAGAQALIQQVPYLSAPGRVGIVSPTYNEHAAAFAAAGWQVVAVAEPADAAGLEAAVVVNPNNPDGRCWSPEALAALSAEVALLVVDESFADTAPELSLVGGLARAPGRVVVLRSFGKFFGLAGVRLGFAVASPALAEALAERLGPWAVSGPAIEIAAWAYADHAWIAETRGRLAAEAAALDAWAGAQGWSLVGGTTLFRTYETGDAAAAQAMLACRHVWSRRFSYSPGWLRLGTPAGAAERARLSAETLRA